MDPTKPIISDINLDASKFKPSSVSNESHEINNFIEEVSATAPKWWQVGIAKYREMLEAGETTLPKPVFLPEATEATIPSREPGRNIPIRIMTPEAGVRSKGILLHMHGGAFAIGSHQHHDPALKRRANELQLTAISVGYRLAPEHPWPAGPEDCYDVAEYLVDHAKVQFGGELLFLMGESAGGGLVALTTFHLMRTRPNHILKGIVCSCGYFDISLSLPSMALFKRAVIINSEILRGFNDLYVPALNDQQRREPSVSPLYEDMHALASQSPTETLPPAMFIGGTEDPLLDDTVFMGSKWMATGSKAIIKIYAGGPHVFTSFPNYTPALEANKLMMQFMREKIPS